MAEPARRMEKFQLVWGRARTRVGTAPSRACPERSRRVQAEQSSAAAASFIFSASCHTTPQALQWSRRYCKSRAFAAAGWSYRAEDAKLPGRARRTASTNVDLLFAPPQRERTSSPDQSRPHASSIPCGATFLSQHSTAFRHAAKRLLRAGSLPEDRCSSGAVRPGLWLFARALRQFPAGAPPFPPGSSPCPAALP